MTGSRTGTQYPGDATHETVNGTAVDVPIFGDQGDHLPFGGGGEPDPDGGNGLDDRSFDMSAKTTGLTLRNPGTTAPGAFGSARRFEVFESVTPGSGADRVDVGRTDNITRFTNSGNDTIYVGRTNDRAYGGHSHPEGSAGYVRLWRRQPSYRSGRSGRSGAHRPWQRPDSGLWRQGYSRRVRNDAFVFVGVQAFSGNAGELPVQQDVANSRTLVERGRNGDGIADFRIALTGLYTLVAADFAL